MPYVVSDFMPSSLALFLLKSSKKKNYTYFYMLLLINLKLYRYLCKYISIVCIHLDLNHFNFSILGSIRM